ncbi:ABC transporter ATP-binding protein [Candidatus Woesearchaeota archaeon]|jgi:ABC-2 type transport system ATP-binding protein|nr:ABC transporter ATP-binding protein [Candidatus Woesearchaeota archaeon]MBT3538342.1 ABC transporter ATP-binding protein [Candidatus Woesearchaeota archaeon]MBT4698319.1 ABC transporter ATP-binding protein [Candidatus Woesearchaeota archaeon]MBT4716782.1 ABC transporter ATP-binding protein [Candidatus Woesearchaeota archaeon]MBT7106011.1 ABC transporter ATP-binding protein [Candidatus Woesearchaeota archaeon]
MPGPERHVVEAKNVSKSINGKKIIEDININVKQGEVYGIVGASGSGRTILLEIIQGFTESDTGTIHITPYSELAQNIPKRIKVKKTNLECRKLIGFSSQKPSFYENLTVEENFNYFGRLYNMSEAHLEQRIRHLCKVCSLENLRMSEAGELPMTAQRRFDIALALLHEPEVLILDEPAADLDVAYREYIYKLINRINALGTTVIIGTHFLNELDILCHRIGILHNKRIIAEGPVKEVIRRYGDEKKITLITENAFYQSILEALDKDKLKILSISKRNEQLIIKTTEAHKTLRDLITIIDKNNENIISLTVEEPGLSEVFFRLAEGKQAKQ